MGPKKSAPTPPRPDRAQTLRARPMREGDLPALYALLASAPESALFAAEGWPKGEEIRSLLLDFPRAQFALIRDHKIMGAICAAREAFPGDLNAHPWAPLAGLGATRLSQVEAGRPADGLTSAIRGLGILLDPALDPRDLNFPFQCARILLAQQLGAAGAWSLVRPQSWAQWRAYLSPEAFLQQVHAGGIADIFLEFYLDAGYLMRGFKRGDAGDRGALEVLMWRAARAR